MRIEAGLARFTFAVADVDYCSNGSTVVYLTGQRGWKGELYLSPKETQLVCKRPPRQVETKSERSRL